MNALSLRLSALFLLAMATAVLSDIAIISSSDVATYQTAVGQLTDDCTAVSAGGVDEFSLKGDEGRWKNVLKKVRDAAPRVVVAIGPLAARLANRDLSDIPLLYFMVPNPLRYGLQGDNVAGISLDVPGKVQFARYQDILPNLRTIGVLYDPAKSAALVEQARTQATALGLTLIGVPVTSHKKVPGALRELRGKIDALWSIPDDTVLTTDSFRFLLVTTLENRLPFLAMSEIFVKVGALATIAPVQGDLVRQVCGLIGEHNAGRLDLTAVDVVAPDSSQLVINRKTAEKIGLRLSDDVLKTAGTVY